MLTRRRFLLGARRARRRRRRGRLRRSTACSDQRAPRTAIVALGSQPSGLPERQHAWAATLARDSDGNPISPRFDRLFFFDVKGNPTPAHARLLEASLRTLERTLPLGTLRAAVHRRLGARLLRARRSRVALADPAGEGALGLRAAGNRRLRPLPAPRLRRRSTARGGRGGARARRAARGRRRSARRLGGASRGGRPAPGSWARDCRRPTRTSDGIPPGNPVPRALRSSWASSRACARTRRARTT